MKRIYTYFVVSIVFAISTSRAMAQEVQNHNDSGAGSLREIISLAETGATITFAPELNGTTVVLTSGEIAFDKSLNIDASELPDGLYITGNYGSRIFKIGSDVPRESPISVMLQSLHLYQGKAAGENTLSNSGGSILNQNSNLTVIDSSFEKNFAHGSGGAIYHKTGTLTLMSCSFFNNSAIDSGGAIYFENHSGITSILSHSTFGTNSADSGGAIVNQSSHLSLIHCTIVNNNGRSNGGGVSLIDPESFGTGQLTLKNSIIAQNNSQDGTDLKVQQGAVLLEGANLVSSGAGGSGLVDGQSGVLVTPDPALAPIGFHGGSTQTMPPLMDSPAINASIDSLSNKDQRGYPRNDTPDLGAAESSAFILVDTNADNDPETRTSLREALVEAGSSGIPGTVVQFSPSFFDGTEDRHTIPLTRGTITVPEAQGLLVYAGNIQDRVSVDGLRKWMCFRTGPGIPSEKPSSMTFHSLEIINGAGSLGSGPAILNIHNALTIVNSSFTGHRGGGYGGAIGSFDSTLRISNTVFDDNAGHNGGAISNSGEKTNIRTILSKCLFTNNSVQFFGGALFNRALNGYSAYLEVSHCSFSENQATTRSGGAIYNRSTVATVITRVLQSTIGNNFANFHGGGIYNEAMDGIAKVEVAQSTISNNRARRMGGGIYSEVLSGSASVLISNSIVANNEADNSGNDIQIDEATEFTGFNKNFIGEGSIGIDDADGVEVIEDPFLAPIGFYGGSTQTMPPAPNSPAINAGIGNTAPFDQKGDPRPEIGFDLGAVEIQPLVVNTIADQDDSPPGPEISLREAITRETSAFIAFDPSLAGKTILLEFGEIAFEKSLSIDASQLPGGLTIDGQHNSRIFKIGPEAEPVSPIEVSLVNLHLKNGSVTDEAFPGNAGGAIFNQFSTLSISSSTLTENSAEESGGAIYNHHGSLEITDTLFANNASTLGGGIFNDNSTLNLQHTTFDSNMSERGGAVYNGSNATIDVFQSTFASNQAIFGGAFFSRSTSTEDPTLNIELSTIADNNASVRGGGVFNDENARLHIIGSIVAKNTSDEGPDIYNRLGTVTSAVANLLTNTSGFSGLVNGQNGIFVVADPLLAPLQDYGGSTPTMPPIAGSPAIDVGGETQPGGNDQRGYPRIVNNARDVGAIEYQGTQEDFALDFYFNNDGDDWVNGLEKIIGSDPDTFDSTNERGLQLSLTDGELALIVFGFNPAFSSNAMLSLIRTTDFKSSEIIATSESDDRFPSTGDPLLITIEEEDELEDGRMFYQLEAKPKL